MHINVQILEIILEGFFKGYIFPIDTCNYGTGECFKVYYFKFIFDYYCH